MARRVRQEQVAEVDLHGDPDLAVRVHLGADDVEPEVAVVQRVRVRVLARRRELAAHRLAREEVADAVVAVAGGVRALRVLVRARRDRQVQLVEGGQRVEVAERLAHRAGGVALAGADALADHAVLDQVAELVAEDREVVGAVHARGVERAGQRLPDELVRRRVRAVGAGAHVRVVAAAGRGAGLRVPDQPVVAERRERRARPAAASGRSS